MWVEKDGGEKRGFSSLDSGVPRDLETSGGHVTTPQLLWLRAQEQAVPRSLSGVASNVFLALAFWLPISSCGWNVSIATAQR